MKIVADTAQYMVIDDFLNPSEWDEIFKYLSAENYSNVSSLGWNGAWRLDDGPVMKGPTVSWGKFPNADIQYPTKRGIDLMVKAILERSSKFSHRIGEKDKNWDGLTAIPMLYPRGTSLFWHRDAEGWTGSYTYYAHKEWNVQWGGELLVADEATAQSVPKEHGVFLVRKRPLMGIQGEASFGAHLDNSEANNFLLESGLGSYIMPKPNRLVIIVGGNPHCVTKVDAAAGDHIRMSISGFFLNVAYQSVKK